MRSSNQQTKDVDDQNQIDSDEQSTRIKNENNKIENVQNKDVLPLKSSLCRFYLRGNCPYQKQKCQFAHGIADLHFTKYDPEIQKNMKQIYTNFRANHPINQLDMTVSEENKNYINLYQFQCHMAKKNSLNSLNQEKFELIKQQNVFEQKQQILREKTKSKIYKQQSRQKREENYEKDDEIQRKVYIEKKNETLRASSPLIERKKSKSKSHAENDEKHEHKSNAGIVQEQYEPEKIYTLKQINMNRTLKIQIRKQFHKHQFFLFLQLISKIYGSQQKYNQDKEFRFQYDILELEYYRVGFNKLMTRIKISFLIDYLQQQYKGGYFKFTTTMIPYLKKSATYYLKLAPEPEIIEYYRRVYHDVTEDFKKKQKQIRQEDVKQAMMTAVRDWWRIPPIIQLLRFKHSTFKDFIINYILKGDPLQKQSNVNLDWITSESILLAQIHKIIQEQITKKQYCIVNNDVLARNSKFSKALVEQCVKIQRNQDCVNIDSESKQNKIMNQNNTYLKKEESNKLIMIKCPNIKTQIITRQAYIKPDAKYQYQFGIKLQILLQQVIQFAINRLNLQKLLIPQENNKNQEKLVQQQNNQQLQKKDQQKNILKSILQQAENKKVDQLQDYKIIEIQNAEQLLENSQTLLTASSILGVDLQGSLVDPETGYLSLIQINHFSRKTIYLIDYWTINKNETVQGIQKCKKLLTKILNNNNIVKVIHDSRNDSQSLYNLLKVQQNHQQDKNFVDKQINNFEKNHSEPSYQEKHQIQHTRQNIKLKFSNLFDTAASQQIIRQIQDPENYNSNTPGLNEVLEKYGQLPNKHKQKFHKIWQQDLGDPSVQRPMSQQFKQYCSMDVLGLPKVYIAMSKRVNPYFLVFISQLHSNFSQAKDSKRKAIQKFNDPSKQQNNQSIKVDHHNQIKIQSNQKRSRSSQKSNNLIQKDSKLYEKSPKNKNKS